ncbi:MAG: hypothetical protein SCK57_05785 [Bacillota bacterium]|nr:hypothetical protein [Bacillota bacterium]MDW7677153.1 hypothetical protein [Bacillota bacterium]
MRKNRTGEPSPVLVLQQHLLSPQQPVSRTGSSLPEPPALAVLAGADGAHPLSSITLDPALLPQQPESLSPHEGSPPVSMP